MVSLNIEHLPEQEAIIKLRSWLLDFRRESGLTQEAAAKEIFVSRETWRRWEKGESIPNGLALLHIQRKAREWELIHD